MTEQLSTQPTDSISLIREAMNNGADPQVLRELLSVKQAWEADEARKAYFRAISEFQKRAPIIDKADDAHGKKYAKMDRIWRTIRPLLTELGLSCTWQGCEIGNGGQLCHVTGQLGHVLGHSVPLVMDVAIPEMIKGQNAAQQIGSARTYAQRYAFCAALGIQTGEDDDAAALTAKINKKQAEEITGLLKQFPNWHEERDSLLNWLGADQIDDIHLADFGLAVVTINKKLKTAASK